MSMDVFDSGVYQLASTHSHCEPPFQLCQSPESTPSAWYTDDELDFLDAEFWRYMQDDG